MASPRIETLLTAFGLSLSLAVTGCGSGGGSSSTSDGSTSETSNVALPGSVQTMDEDPEAETSDVTGALLVGQQTYTDFPTDSDYAQDEIERYVQSPARNATTQADFFLCVFKQMKPQEMLGEGPFLAMVNESKCYSNSGQSSRTVPFLGEVTEEDGNAVINFWSERQGFRVRGEAIVKEAPSSDNPNGTFTVNYATQYKDADNNWVSAGKGTLKSLVKDNGQPAVEFYQDWSGDGWSNIYRGQIGLQTSDQDGLAHLGFSWDDGETTGSGKYALAYNDSYLHTKYVADDDSEYPECRERGNHYYQNWGYGLYDKSDGSSVALETGFPFKYDGEQGWISYWGVWYSGEANLSDDSGSQTITRLPDGSGKGGNDYVLDETGSDINGNFTLYDDNGDKYPLKSPKTLYYTVEQSDDLNDLYGGDPNGLDGADMKMKYAGPGQVWFMEVDKDGNGYDTYTNYDTDSSGNYISKLNLKAGTVVTDGSNNEYVLKPTTQALELVTADNCTVDAQTAIDHVSLPPDTFLESVGHDWTDMPDTPDDPDIIEGELVQ